MVKLERKTLNFFYYPSSITELKVIEKSLSFVVEGAEFSDLVKKGLWDGKAKFFDRKKCCFNFGLLKIVTDALEKKNLKYELIDNRKFKFSLTVDKLEFKTDREYQKQSVKNFIATKEGILKIFTRLGKTIIFSELVRNFLRVYPDMKILFVCDTKEILLQSIQEVKKYCDLKSNQVGKIWGETFEPSQVTFCTIQTLDSALNRKLKIGKDIDGYYEKKAKMRLKKKRLLEYLETVDFLTVDECQEFGSDPRLGILRKIENTEYRLFLSATPFSKESKKLFSNLNIKSTSGEIFFEMNEEDGVEQGYLSKSKVILLLINHNNNKNINQSTYQNLVDDVIVNNIQRNSIIVNVIETLRKAQLKSLILFSYEKHVSKISDITGDVYLYGGTDMSVRKNVKKSFLRGKGKILLATNIFNKGVTLPQVQVVVNAAGGKERNNIIQKKGRVLGITADKDRALIIDFIDVYDYFSEHSYSRIKAYSSTTGKKNIVVLDTNSEDFYFDFRSLLTDWFGK